MRIFILLIVLLSCKAVAEGQNIVYDENAEVRKVERFNGIEISGAVSLYLSQGDAIAVAVSAGDDKYNNKIKTEVQDGILRISVDGGVWNGFNWTNRKLKAYVTAAGMNRLNVSGASYVNISGTLKSDDIKMDVSGASEVKGNIDVGKLDIDISGASETDLTGTVREGSIDASGACKVSSYQLVFGKCKASTSGASKIKVTVNGELNADATGGSVIYYKGTGVVKTINTSGGAAVKSRSGGDD